MTKIAYLECPTGLAGDMCLGALVHAGVPLDYLAEKLKPLGISHEYRLWAELVHRNGQQATKVHVELLSEPKHRISAEEGVDPHTTFAHHLHSTKSNSIQHTHTHDSQHSHSHSSDHNHEPHETDHGHSRHLPEIEQLIRAAQLPPRVEAWSLAVFRRLAEAEGAVHGISPDQVHFHEVGATDAIVDIVGTCLGLDWLGIEQMYCSPMPTGGGTIRAAHGQLPVPSPAVLKLWEMRQVPIYSNGIQRELVTPTGAAIATTLATDFGAPPTMTLQKVGLGAGSRNLPIPNMVRLWIGEAAGEERREKKEERREPQFREQEKHEANRVIPGSGTADLQETIAVLETQIDDLNPQAIGYVMEALFAVGAVDVFTQAIAMKKSRPGLLLNVICHPDQIEACESLIFRETTTLGIRRSMQQRSILQRMIQTVQTPYGEVRVKVAWHRGSLTNAQPEYEDCAAIARQHNIPWREVHRLAQQAWHKRQAITEQEVNTEKNTMTDATANTTMASTTMAGEMTA
ncbi:nickel pincer cofactor biosynthesis protein LarC [Oscillatoria sp. FACHB-1407]|uniref:nickel pincer cofactor biosynthesis protein LarC n=1 Tax=Oscillatoria sp. FACHB-1407 TaxID=2692847 RepID=UPI001688E379|nr:nickel pincer cofactor biosynthesis protein LarC [Oscillatoria sp. FACHB-1407]MBD2460697.1 nickel pincer cofactor biosynthesis protein LarC [Oscillatoria sp. FACHB-1407]